MDPAPPKDRWHLVYITLMLHGLGTLTAWEMFIIAQDYFKLHKLVGTEYSEHYLTYIGWASQTPNLIFSWCNIFVQLGCSLTTRIVWSLAAEVVLFVVTVILAMVDTSQCSDLFFWLTMITAFLINTFNAIFQNSVYGVAARLPPKFTGAVILGSNICGTWIACLSWLTKLLDNLRTSAIYYFIGGMTVMLLCFDTYLALPLNKYYRHHDALHQRTLRNISLAVTDQNQQSTKKIPYWTIVKNSAVQLYNICYVFFISLTVFPAVQAQITPSQPGFLGSNFTLITCFFTFNLWAVFGSITASLWQYPKPKWLALFVTIRILFIPFFLMCNFNVSRRTIPVWVDNDWAYWFGAALLGWSSGHGSALGMMYVGGTVDPEYSSTASMIGAAMLVTGIVGGITFSRLCPIIVTLDLWRGL